MSIKLDLKIILFILLFCFTSQIEMYAILMIFAMIHELGHLIAGLILGFKLQEISITPFGMKIEFKPQCEEYNTKVGKGKCLAIKKAIVAISGPLTNFAIICIMIIAMSLNSELLINPISTTIIYSNFLIAIFNLIPIYPLDGGRIVKEILHIKCGLQKSHSYIYKISKISIIALTVISSILILYIQNISILIILAYLWGVMLVERKKYYIKEKMKKIILLQKESEKSDFKAQEVLNYENACNYSENVIK